MMYIYVYLLEIHFEQKNIWKSKKRNVNQFFSNVILLDNKYKLLNININAAVCVIFEEICEFFFEIRNLKWK